MCAPGSGQADTVLDIEGTGLVQPGCPSECVTARPHTDQEFPLLSHSFFHTVECRKPSIRKISSKRKLPALPPQLQFPITTGLASTCTCTKPSSLHLLPLVKRKSVAIRPVAPQLLQTLTTAPAPRKKRDLRCLKVHALLLAATLNDGSLHHPLELVEGASG